MWRKILSGLLTFLAVFLSIRFLHLFSNLGFHFTWKSCLFCFCFLSLSSSLWAHPAHSPRITSSPLAPQPWIRISGGISLLRLHGDDRRLSRCGHWPIPTASSWVFRPQILATRAQAALWKIFQPLYEASKLNSMYLPHYKTISSIKRGIVYVLVPLYTQCINSVNT